jgi:ankyrin repeat protein
LHVAAADGNLALAQRLLDLGADPDLLDAVTHATPLSWARDSDQQALAGLLEPLTTE